MTTTDSLDFTLPMSPIARSLGAETANVFEAARLTLAVMIWLDDGNE